jgi:hypothetical protein
MSDDRTGHLSEDHLVAFLGHELLADEQREVELHLARCAECRDELVAVTEILQPDGSEWTDRQSQTNLPARKIPWRVLAPVAAAAAAVILMVAGPWNPGGTDDAPQHRDTPAQSSLVPTPVAPLGTVSAVEQLVWRGVDGADRYRLTLYDSEGEVLWKATTPDTVLDLPESVVLNAGSRYLWRLEARVGWDMWEASELIDFKIEPDEEQERQNPESGDQARNPDTDGTGG